MFERFSSNKSWCREGPTHDAVNFLRPPSFSLRVSSPCGIICSSSPSSSNLQLSFNNSQSPISHHKTKNSTPSSYFVVVAVFKAFFYPLTNTRDSHVLDVHDLTTSPTTLHVHVLSDQLFFSITNSHIHTRTHMCTLCTLYIYYQYDIICFTRIVNEEKCGIKQNGKEDTLIKGSKEIWEAILKHQLILKNESKMGGRIMCVRMRHGVTQQKKEMKAWCEGSAKPNRITRWLV